MDQDLIERAKTFEFVALWWAWLMRYQDDVSNTAPPAPPFPHVGFGYRAGQFWPRGACSEDFSEEWEYFFGYVWRLSRAFPASASTQYIVISSFHRAVVSLTRRALITAFRTNRLFATALSDLDVKDHYRLSSYRIHNGKPLRSGVSPEVFPEVLGSCRCDILQVRNHQEHRRC